MATSKSPTSLEPTQKKTRVLVIVPFLHQGGSQRQVTYLLQNIDRSRYDVHLGYFISHDIFYKELIADPDRSHLMGSGKTINFFSWLAMIRLVRKLKPDLVHFYMQSANIIGGVAHYAFRKIPIIFSVGMSRQPWYHYTVYRILKNRPTLTICNSREILKELVNLSKFPERKIRVVHNPLDSQKFRPFDQADKAAARRTFGLSEGELVIASVGRLSHQKNQLATVEAIHRLKEAGRLPANIRFLLVGKTSFLKYQNKLRALIASHRLGDIVEIREPIQQIVEFYNAVDGVFQPSHHEGLSNVVIESQACGTPVALSREGDNDHLIEHGVNGISFSVANIDAVVAGLSDLIQLCLDPEHKAAVGKQSREGVSRRFSMREAIQLRERIYDELLQESAKLALQRAHGET